MKAVRLLLLLAVLVCGLVIGAQNSQQISVSLAFWALETTSGLAIIAALLLGALAGGGLVIVGVVIPLYARLRRASKAAATAEAPLAPAPQASSPFDGR